ncbi:WD40 repeat domain-containing serine/threonine protein kinase [Streptomyces indicus]|uniref:Serine/threonine protein kinase n=1 Tax=Streptomyces indicus TaxID=417292 RepID=A0A1G9HWR5_9ACTN|nr:WD40 repeat domain-containing serine/threonine protein kinase [Streptomyces indicus]SDL17265.1 Serine/threonine protein kinase [Streptomyces indicus]
MGTPLGPDDPERIGDYWLAARLGAGGQGVVYEAYDAQGARVALKALHRGSADWVRERFGREADAARKVASFCTARILDVSLGGDGGEGAAPAFIVSEYVPGPTLADQVRSRGTLDPDALLRLATGAATALAAIHHAGVIHRDLKPGNILLGPDGPRIIDFGIARAPDMSLTATGALLGTLGYMAPEVLAGGRATAAADVFAWGAVVLYAASGTEPFRGEHIGEVARRTAALDPDLSSIPPRIRPLIASALAKDPALRPGAAELVLGLVGDLPKAADPRLALLEAGAERAGGPADDRTADTTPALGERAEAAFTGLPPDAQLAAQQLLLRMVVPGDAPDGSQDSVRTVDRAEWYDGRPESEQRPARLAVDRLTEAGALTGSDDGSVRPASAALLPAWRRLHDWVAADRTGLALHRSLGRAARAWAANGERADDLLHGSALRTCLDWLPTAPFQLRPNPLEVRFLDASRAEATRAARRRRQLLSGLAVLTVLALLGGLFGVFQARESSRQRETAELRRAQATARSVAQAAESLRSTEPDTALLLSLASWQIAEVPEARAALGAGATQRTLSTVALPRVTDGPGAGEALLGGADSLLSYRPGSAEIWDLTKGAAGARKPRVTFPGGLREPRNDRQPPASPDGKHLLAWQKGNTYQLVSSRDGKPTGAVYTAPENTEPESLSNDGHAVFVDNGRHAGPNRAALLTPDGRKLAEWPTDQSPVLSPDGSLVSVCEPDSAVPLTVWSVDDTRVRPAFAPVDDDASDVSACGTVVGFSGDGRRMAMADDLGVQVWDTANGRAIGHVTLTEDGNRDSWNAQLTATGGHVFGWSQDGDIKVLDVASGEAVLDIPGVKSAGSDGFLIDGAVLDERTKSIAYRSTRGNEVVRLDVSGVLSSSTTNTESAHGVAISPDGTTGLVRLGIRSEAYQLIDLTTGKQKGARVPVPLPDFEIGIPSGPQSLSSDGRLLAHLDVKDGGTGPMQVVTIRDAKENRKVWDAPVPGPRDLVNIGLSPDGRYISVLHEGAGQASGEGGDLEIWDIQEKKKLHRFRKLSGPSAFSPDNRTLVTGRGDVLDLASRKTRKVPGFDREPTGSLAFSPDGRSLGVLKESGWLELWDGQVRERTARMPGSTVQGGTHYGQQAHSLAFSPEGRFLAAVVGQNGGAVQLWDLESRAGLGKPIDVTGNRIDSLGFRDSTLVTLSGSRAQALSLDPDDLAETICKKAGRDITEEEWELYVPDAPYRSVC